METGESVSAAETSAARTNAMARAEAAVHPESSKGRTSCLFNDDLNT
jgi:hypothetical protein